MTEDAPQIAGYQIQHVIGAGGMATVYLAENLSLQRPEALKIINPDIAADPDARRRFEREAATTASLIHRNIIAVFARGETPDGHPWIAMEYVGNDAEAALRHNAMTPTRALHIITEIARALDYAHSHNVIHHDVKPANFLLADQAGEPERVVLTDFGSAAAPRRGPSGNATMASVAYAAPEVFLGDPTTARTDVYALACSFFRMLTGQHPYPGLDATATAAAAQAHIAQQPPRLSDQLPWASTELDHVIATALAKNPQDRYTSAGDFAAAAADALQPTPDVRTVPGTVELPPPAFGPIAEPLTRARSIRTSRLGAAIGAGIAIIAVAAWLAAPSPPPSTPSAGQPGSSPTSSTSRPTQTPASTDDIARLIQLLPPGYPQGACTPTPAVEADTAAVMACTASADLAATDGRYTLARSKEVLRSQLDAIIGTSITMPCPGVTPMLSPGPWHRMVRPDVPVGTLYCAVRDGRPLVAWTVDDALLLATIQALPGGPNLEQLYTWWASHS